MSEATPSLCAARFPTAGASVETWIPSFGAPAEDPFSWLRETAEAVGEHLLRYGAVLVQGLPLDGPDALADAREALGLTVQRPVEAFTRRGEFSRGVVSPIDWPQDRAVCPFQESAFSMTFPSVVLTACLTPPAGTGRARLADARRIAGHLPTRLASRVRADGWIMTRVFHDGFGLSPEEAFSVPDRAALEEVFEAGGIGHQQLSEGVLRTIRHRPGVIAHPATGQECWFNQISFLNAHSLDPAERTVMTKAFGRDMPMDTSFGDGSPLSVEDVAAVQRAWDAVTSEVPWHRGDLLLVDNIATAQGRSAYEGSPEFLVTFATGFPRRPGTTGAGPAHTRKPASQ
ncbi:TauD/TfdA family dioxygenase [Amycolatopsis sp. FBCC-B4732]|uniref:TauD/TfdA family dioxygenase n=1 Tax=Amycolatopsis sp. FBCC-B4732 TaxID=3079339 RepID=UPI001FF6C95A|nr:TauD/TfdA family dioxygenase [Amycolatopsis sp. FBCC-B4732]UOX90009.1 TauD/TfdA family dioxygenase [Amycolatopsis sp. FBCC-B4732]